MNNINIYPPLIGAAISMGGIIFQIGRQSEKLNDIGLKVHALEEYKDSNTKMLYDIHGTVEASKEKLLDVASDVDEIKKRLLK